MISNRPLGVTALASDETCREGQPLELLLLLLADAELRTPDGAGGGEPLQTQNLFHARAEIPDRRAPAVARNGSEALPDPPAVLDVSALGGVAHSHEVGNRCAGETNQRAIAAHQHGLINEGVAARE